MARPKDDVVIGRILTLAQSLFAERGIDAVSMRQISAGAGSGNPNVVQYHFGNVEGLISAILKKEVPAIELAQAEALGHYLADGVPSLAELMRLAILPILEHLDENGDRTFARFYLALLYSRKYPVWELQLPNLQPTSLCVTDLIVEATGLPKTLVLERQRLTAILALNSVFNRLPAFAEPVHDQILISDAIAMAAAAIVAPSAQALLNIAVSSSHCVGACAPET